MNSAASRLKLKGVFENLISLSKPKNNETAADQRLDHVGGKHLHFTPGLLPQRHLCSQSTRRACVRDNDALGQLRNQRVALKKWQQEKPELFVKRVYNQAGLDS